jgi:hypothetical protein
MRARRGVGPADRWDDQQDRSDEAFGQKLKRSSPTPKATSTQPWCSVYSGRECIGHLVGRGPLGVEAFDAHDKSLGIFKTAPLAASALVGKAEGGR